MHAFLDRLEASLRRAPLAVRWAVAAVVYYGAIRLSLRWDVAAPHLPLLWLPTGIGYGFVVVGGYSFALPIAAASFASAAMHGFATGPALLFAAGAAGSALTIVWLLRRRPLRPHGERFSDTIFRSIAGVFGCAVGAGIGTAGIALAFALPIDGAQFLALAFLGQLTGYFTIGPFARAWLVGGVSGRAGPLERGLIVVAAGGIATAVGSGLLGAAGPSSYLIFPVVVWAAMRSGRRGVTAVILLVTLIAARDAANGTGPFLSGATESAAVSLDGFLIVMSLTGLLLVGLETARLRSERTVRASEQRFRALTENATDLVTVLAADGSILYQSPSSLGVLGWRPDELTGIDVFTHIHPDDAERCHAALARMVEEDGDVVVSLRYRHKDGHWVDVVSTGRNLLDDPAVGGVVVNSRDVSENVRAERERQEAEKRYRDLVEQLPLVSYVNEIEMGLPPRYISPQIEVLLGHPVQTWYREAGLAETLIHADDAAPMREFFLAGRREGSAEAEYRMIAADGRVVWVLDHMVTLRDEAGEPTAVQGFLVDITRQKLLEEQLRRAQRMEALGLLAGGVAHDFNNLLTAISGYTELALAHVDDPARCSDDLAEVSAAADRAAGLTRQLLAFGRRQVLEHDVVDLNAIVEETRQLLARLIGEDIRVVTALEPDLGVVHADAGQLVQVLVNLAVNARDAMPDGGTLTLATANESVAADDREVPPGEYVALSVSDTGNGIDAATLEHLFEPFFTTKPVGEGTGLGLAMVYGIVEQTSGHVFVRSRPGHGAEFRILLPRTQDAPRGALRDEGDAVGGRETVLLVEDEEVVRHLTTEMLERQGYRVLAAADPHEALAVTEPWDVLVTDVVMPGMNGPELAERLASSRAGMAVLFMSGYSGDALAERGRLDGDLLEKPFTMDELSRKVREAIDAAVAAPAVRDAPPRPSLD